MWKLGRARVRKDGRQGHSWAQDEVDKHNITHFKSWCPVCVAGRARDRSTGDTTDIARRGYRGLFSYALSRGPRRAGDSGSVGSWWS